KRILEEAYAGWGEKADGFNPGVIERELAEYDEADRIVVCSRAARQSFLDRGFSPERIGLARIGTDLTRFHPTMEKDPDGKTVLYAGNIVPFKGLYTLLEAAKQMDSTLNLRLAGNPSQSGDRLRAALAAASGVKLLGILDLASLRDEMSRASVFVFPSIMDGFGMVVAEAMACGTACIVSDQAGASDLIRPGANGWIFRAGDSADLARCLEEAVSDPDRCREFGRQAREDIALSSSWEGYTADLDGIMNGVRAPGGAR
ncbi:MAG: glycosyltransferase family 4 protein, partial [Fimbriimonadaceae bacterium]|nr:glycosyltransferase family 4 protein [Fimbriimonadaceae bacterium]